MSFENLTQTEEPKIYKTNNEPLIYESHEKLKSTNEYYKLPKSKLSAILGSAGTGKSFKINEIKQSATCTRSRILGTCGRRGTSVWHGSVRIQVHRSYRMDCSP